MITVFTSSWNHGEFLAEAIDSVLKQTHEDFEYLLYDDGSTDNTKEVMESYDDPRIKKFYLSKQANVGCVINQSFRDMSGDFWVWCPADDILRPTLLESKLRESEKHSYNTVIYSDWEILDGQRVALKHMSLQEFKKAMATSCPIGMTGIWIPRGVIHTVGNFPEHLVCSEDFYWVLMALNADIEFQHIPEVLYTKRKHGNSTTHRHTSVMADVVQEIRRELGFIA